MGIYWQKTYSQRFKKLSLKKICVSIFKIIYGTKSFSEKEIKLKRKFFNAGLDYSKRDLYYYLPKLILPFLVTFLVFIILNTNLNLRKDELLTDFNYATDKYHKVSLFGLNADEYQALKDKEKYLMTYIFDNIDPSDYKGMSLHSEKIKYISDIISSKYQKDIIDLFLTSERAIAKYEAINNIKLHTNHILLIILSFILGYFLIDFILFLMKHWHITNIEEENNKLEMLTVLVGDNANTTTYEILNILLDNSNIFKQYLKEAYNNYLSDNQAALLSLACVPYDQFKTLSKTLLQYQNADKNKAIDNLKRHLERKKKKQQDKEEHKIEVKTLIALFLLIPPFVFLLIFWIYPLLVIFSNLG